MNIRRGIPIPFCGWWGLAAAAACLFAWEGGKGRKVSEWAEDKADD
jgi:hypothetical protein